jgi:NADPH:quinone reductase-like Zn-dependent oxidoreductase
MKAVVCDRYGSPEVLQFREVRKPEPKDDEVLIRSRATTVSSADWRVRSLTVPAGFRIISRLMLGLSRPGRGILGTELAGVVERVGRKVSRFGAGDEVFAFPGSRMGCHAEYRCMPENGAVALKPPELSWAEAAALSFGGTTALDFFRRGKLKSGEKVLVNGASGAVGTALVRIAAYLGAEVTAVCGPASMSLLRSLGADHVVDYTREDFTASGLRYDVIVDTAGTAPLSRCRGSLAERGRLLLVLAGLPEMLAIPWVAMTDTRKVIAGPAAERPEDVRFLADLAATGHYRPVIDRCYPFERIVEAHRYVDTGRKKGNVAITMDEGESAGA